MSEDNDNKLENKFFEIILKNRKINEEILKIYDLINSQNIGKNDKQIINKTIFGFGLINENDEISSLLKNIRNDKINSFLLDLFTLKNSNYFSTLYKKRI